MKSKIKMSDLLVKYCEMQSDESGSVVIFRVLNLDTYIAVIVNNKGELLWTRYLDRDLREALKNNTLTVNDLFDKLYLWIPMSRFNDDYNKSGILLIIESARAKGYKEEITVGKWKLGECSSEDETGEEEKITAGSLAFDESQLAIEVIREKMVHICKQNWKVAAIVLFLLFIIYSLLPWVMKKLTILF